MLFEVFSIPQTSLRKLHVKKICNSKTNPAFDPGTNDDVLNMKVLDNTNKLMKSLRRKHQLVGSLNMLVHQFQDKIGNAWNPIFFFSNMNT